MCECVCVRLVAMIYRFTPVLPRGAASSSISFTRCLFLPRGRVNCRKCVVVAALPHRGLLNAPVCAMAPFHPPTRAPCSPLLTCLPLPPFQSCAVVHACACVCVCVSVRVRVCLGFPSGLSPCHTPFFFLAPSLS